MAQPSRVDVIRTKPIGEGLNAFYNKLTLTYKESGLLYSIDARQLDAEGNGFPKVYEYF